MLRHDDDATVRAQSRIAKRRYAALVRRLAQEPRPISSIDRMSLGLDPLPLLREGQAPLPRSCMTPSSRCGPRFFLKRARDEAAQRAAYQAWCDAERSAE